MMRGKRTFRLTMLGLLCGGLLLMGIGAGVAFAEFSSFTYGGQEEVGPVWEQSQTLVVPLLTKGTASIGSTYSSLAMQLRKLGRIETSESVKAGTAEISLRFKSGDVNIDYWLEDVETNRAIQLYWTGSGRDVRLFMAYKDRILEDLRNRQFSDYYISNELTDAVIFVNPADVERVVLR